MNSLPLRINNLDDCIELSTSVFGASYHTKSQLKEYLLSKNVLVYGCYIGGELIGLLIASKMSNTTLEKQVKIKLEQLPEEFIYVNSILVSPSFQKKGIGTILMQQAVDYAKKLKLKMVAIAWKKPSGINAEKLNINAGFKTVLQLKTLWKTDCENNVFACPNKTKTCVCSGVLMMRE